MGLCIRQEPLLLPHPCGRLCHLHVYLLSLHVLLLALPLATVMRIGLFSFELSSGQKQEEKPGNGLSSAQAAIVLWSHLRNS